MTDGDRDLAERLRDELLDRAWVEREAFVYKIEPLDEALARAQAMPEPSAGEGPIVLLDHYDNCASGGTMDTTIVLGEILQGRARQCRRLRDLRPRSGAAGDRRRHRRRR